MSNQELLFFCENIKLLRINNGLSEKEMAQLLGIGTKSLRSLENGVFPPRLTCDVLFRAKKHFGVLPKDLFLPPQQFATKGTWNDQNRKNEHGVRKQG